MLGVRLATLDLSIWQNIHMQHVMASAPQACTPVTAADGRREGCGRHSVRRDRRRRVPHWAGSSGDVTERRSLLPWSSSIPRRYGPALLRNLVRAGQYVQLDFVAGEHVWQCHLCPPDWNFTALHDGSSFSQSSIMTNMCVTHRCNRRARTSAHSRASTLAPSCGACCWPERPLSCSRAHTWLLTHHVRRWHQMCT
jgi:hypothetical protein